METFTIEGQVREGRGKGPARRTRLSGMVPAILYGGKKDSISIAVNAKQVARILRSETGQYDFHSAGGFGRGRKGDGEGLAGGSGERQIAARGSVPHRDGRAHARDGARA